MASAVRDGGEREVEATDSDNSGGKGCDTGTLTMRTGST